MPRRTSRHTTIAIGASLVLHVVAISDVLVQREHAAHEVYLWPALVAHQQPQLHPQEPAEQTTDLQVVLLDDAQLRALMPEPPPPATEPPHSAPVVAPRVAVRDPGARSAPPAAIPETPTAPTAPTAPAAPSVAPTAPPVAPTAPTAPRSAFAMRAPGESSGVDISLPHVAEGVAPTAPGAAAPGVAPTPETPRSELVRKRDGTYDVDKPTFSAKVARDGTVKFKDRPVIRPGTGIDPGAPETARDPTLGDPGRGIGQGGVGGSMDVTEMIMRKHGQDPHAHEKLAFLDRTRDERAAIATEHKSNQLSKSGRLMRRTLEEMWASTRDPVERKQALFELWDECVETGDPEAVAGAEQARAEIMSFIRTRLRGPAAYTPAEVARFNARKQSRATFAPNAG